MSHVGLAQIKEISPRAAQRLMCTWPGCEIYIPHSLKPEHRLVAVVGADAARGIVRALGGRRIQVPTGSRANDLEKAAEIRALLASGASVPEIARAVGASTRTVRRWRTRLRGGKTAAKPSHQETAPSRDEARPSRERCGWCGEYSAVGFRVPDEIWAEVVPARFRETIACLRCFTRMADERLVPWDRAIEFYPVSLSTHLQCAGYRILPGSRTAR